MDGSQEKPAPPKRNEIRLERGVLKWLAALRDGALRLRFEKAIDALARGLPPQDADRRREGAGTWVDEVSPMVDTVS